MAQTAPPSQDIQEIQFKLHDRFTIFPEGKDAKSLVSLLAVSSSKGLLFAGHANRKELKVFKLRDVVDRKTTGQNVKVRVINLPGEPKVLACSCDGSMLAVNYAFNNTGFLQIYQVESFVTPTLNSLYNLPIAPESNTFALQLLWNPVIPNNIALILIDGSVAMFTLNSGGQYDKVTLGKEHQVKSGCWSPKGKQIVFGFAEGKLQQFKPNLQPARVIPCPTEVYPCPFDCIAVHWLSTFQFAVIFLQRGQDMSPSLFIVNAPKTGQPSYINFHDICYSAPGPRIHQLSFNHIAQWNLLLVTSANGVEVGVLGTKETGETPNWMQYTLLDEARIEMPLTESIDETYPIGFVYDTASLHQVAIGEKKLPVMPMIHVLSTHGHLISYNFLNLSPNAVDVCSPPPPLNDISGQFVSLNETLTVRGPSATLQEVPGSKPNASNSELATLNKPQNTAQGFSDLTFTMGTNMITSTPAFKDKPMALFGTTGMALPTTAGVSSDLTAINTTAATNKPSTGFGFETPTATVANMAPFPQQFGGLTTGTSYGGFSGQSFTVKSGEQNSSTFLQQPTKQSDVNRDTELNKPLYTVPPTFAPPAIPQKQPVKTEVRPVKPIAASNKISLNTVEIDEVIKQMIVIQTHAFETELRHIQQQSKQLMKNIGYPDEIKLYTKQLNDLQEIIEQANDHEFEQDVQSLRHSMNESYAMLAECRAGIDLFNNPNLIRLPAVSSMNPTNRRQLAKLQAYLAANQNQLSQLYQLIDAQWSQYQDIVRRNSKNQMHIPCLDGIYQRMSKLKDLLSRQRTKMNYIKSKLKQKGLNYKPPSDVDVTSVAIGALTKNQSTIDSLADSILSMSLSQVVSQTHAKLSEEKLNAIRDFTKRQQQIAIIKPKRPDRVGLKSEVILETKLETERKQKEIVRKQQQQQQLQYQQQQQQHIAAYKTSMNIATNKTQQQQNYQTQLQQQLLKPQATVSATKQQQQPILAKPTASKPSIVSSQPHTFITPTSSIAATLSFGGNSSFVKTSMSAPKTEESSKSAATSSTPFTGFGLTTSQAGLNFTQSKPLINTAASMANDNKENKTTSQPISFSAKVIGGNDAKPFANLGSKTAIQTNTKQPPPPQGFTAPCSTGFSAFTTTKSATQASGQAKDAAKKPEEATKPFDFAAALTSVAATTPTSAAFGGFVSSTKSTATAAPFSKPIFVSNTTASASTPFAALSSASTFSFNATITTASTPAANNSTKPVTTTTGSSQPAIVTTAVSTETKTPTIATASAATTTAIDTAASPVSSNIIASGTKSSAAPNSTMIASRMQETKPVASAAPISSNTTATTMDEPTDSPFGSLNICKPTAKVAGDSNKDGNIFSGFAAATSAASTGPFSFASAGGAGDGAKSFLNSTTTAGTTANSGFSLVSAATNNPPTANVFVKPVSTGVAAAVTSTTESTPILSSSSTPATAVVGSTTTATAASPTTTAAITSSFPFETPAPAIASTADSLLGSLSVSSSTAASSTAATVATTTSVAAGNIFSGGSSVFTAATATTTTPLFGGAAAVASSAPSMFGSVAPVATTAATPGSGSIFAAAAAVTPQTGGSIFAGIPKPEQSVFSASNATTQSAATGLFAAAAANTKTAAVTGGSIFGGGTSTGFGGPAGGSIFGSGNAASSSPFNITGSPNTGGSMFAVAAAGSKSAEGGSIFSSPTQQSPTSGGSLFSKNTFGTSPTQQQSPGNIFAAGNAQSPTSGGFGTSGGSIFGGSTSANTSASGGSIFGAAAATTASTFGTSSASPGFGSFSQPSAAPTFSSPSAGGFGAPASTGFGSPQQQSAFTKPLFGGPATFGSPQPAFGAPPTFGGAATFGNSKGFGSFAATSPTTTGFGATTQGAAAPKGNIFETLGSQDSGLSFGNLAHTQAPQQKPSFGGSSFMNYRS